MNVMTIGIVLAMSGASAGLLLAEATMGPISQHLWALIAGSGGLLVNIATFRKDEDLCPRILARQAIASVFLSGLFTPAICRAVTMKYKDVQVDEVWIVAVGGFIGLAGSYLLRIYGQQVADLIGRVGVARIKKEFGDNE